MFCDLSLTERKLWFAIARADRVEKDPLLSQSLRTMLAHFLNKYEGAEDVAKAIATCVVIPDQRVPQVQANPVLGTKKRRLQAEKYLRDWYREELDVADVALNAGFPSVVLLKNGKPVDMLEFMRNEVKGAREAAGKISNERGN